MSADRHLTVLSRAWCHLCHDLLDALAPLQVELGFSVEVIDVDSDPELEERWNEAVPVVLAGEGELCRHFLDAAAIRAHFRRIG
ncbi:MAG TPA: glutaredoxin family protein [Zoogloea sp.]|uniref:glutaredoxin family protein n=1 Tax=Zoogloea sp. TaxID=49181 RepID=UPI002C5A3044|nr:glutaredoxin family protein [Zoogloea sp.]HMV17109.1 glutaredoxin family protein [Rhodocyclaceae bacterium]HMV62514.1 glutaredoxin family protein [Rhodocyclaceae bacterium]HMW50570.1 glutaredoxin family protein [Rhodocyclaceae bacterium]HMY48478.1 glutaredoxin family protein [Rhodocyclaceae bacterium]HMZ74777.1 glutaredoxin family protein [Rhodocyclaceae bacterium]